MAKVPLSLASRPHLQGYLLCRPVPETEVLTALAATEQRARLLLDDMSVAMTTRRQPSSSIL